MLIFYFSSQNGDTSSDTSGGFISFFCELLVPSFSGFDGENRTEFVESLQHIVRKCAHYSIYFILAIFLLQFFLTFKRLRKKIWRPFIVSWAFCILYAATDELHQYFVPERSSQITDVAIDSLGALSALLISALIFALWHKFKRK